MESKLYYQDAYLQMFKAQIVKQKKDQAGIWYIVLNQTAFYPTGGGQPCDIGTIQGKRVINVEEIEGEVRHYLESPIEETDNEVSCAINWDRRFDHMQQHAGQHILSAAFEQLFLYKTVSFHLGKEILTIDLDTEVLSEKEVKETEELANRIILENRPMEVKWVTEKELSQFSLRKETKVKENIRLVIIPDFDVNPCGGTHPKVTGEVSAIKILDWERQKKKIRVHFVCGKRVRMQLDQKQKVLLTLTKLLNAPETEMEQAIIRLLEGGKATEKFLEETQEKLLQYEAKEIYVMSNGNQIIRKIFKNRAIQDLQKLARFVIAEDDSVIVFFVSDNNDRLQLVCARGAARDENMKSLMGSALSVINGKGGGSEGFAQGGGTAQVSSGYMMEYLLKLIQ